MVNKLYAFKKSAMLIAAFFLGFSNLYSNEYAIFNPDYLKKGGEAKKDTVWEVLFDGENTGKWISVKSGEFPSKGWEIKDGALFPNKEKGGDIITREKYGDFELVLDFKLTEKANGGIKYFVDSVTNEETGKTSMNGLEYQIIDDYNHPEISKNPHGESSTASLYLVYPPVNKTLNPPGQWNHVKIRAKGKHVEHWLNGVKVVSYKKGSKDFRNRMAKTKFHVYKNYGELREGHIILTEHGDVVYYKNIKVRRL